MTSRLQSKLDGRVLVELLDGIGDLLSVVREESTGSSVGIGVFIVPISVGVVSTSSIPLVMRLLTVRTRC